MSRGMPQSVNYVKDHKEDIKCDIALTHHMGSCRCLMSTLSYPSSVRRRSPWPEHNSLLFTQAQVAG